jgi:hypothetical protein
MLIHKKQCASHMLARCTQHAEYSVFNDRQCRSRLGASLMHTCSNVCKVCWYQPLGVRTLGYFAGTYVWRMRAQSCEHTAIKSACPRAVLI